MELLRIHSRAEQDDDAPVRGPSPSLCGSRVRVLTRIGLSDDFFVSIPRERDTMDQRIGPIDDVITTVTELVQGVIDWSEACRRLPAYDGVQAVD